jgi:hypothetical protein
MLATRGKYIALCDGDDFWNHPRKLQMQIDLMEANPSMTVCHTDYDRLTKFRLRRSVHKRQSSPWLAKGDAYTALLHEWSVMTATCIYRRDVVLSFIGSVYDNPDWPFSDRNRLLFASLLGPFGYVDISTATFRKRYGSATNSGAAARLKMTKATLACIEFFLSRHPPDEDTSRSALIKCHESIYKRAHQDGRIDTMNEAIGSLKALGVQKSRLPHLLRTLEIRMKLPFLARKATKSFIDRHLSGM